MHFCQSFVNFTAATMPFNVMLGACQNLQLNILSENNNESNMDAVGPSLMGTLIT